MLNDLLTPVGRLVAGHPMVMRPVLDDKTKQPKMQVDGVTPRVDSYIALAIQKGTEQHWNQTEWGAKIYADAAASWPNGEYNSLTFAWKITDGDSQVPNKTGKKPCDREGWAGHWILHASNGFAINCYHHGKYHPTQQIKVKEEIKTGDYARLVLSVKSNQSQQSPGMYVNPSMFELYRAGIMIVSENAPDPAAFAAETGALPAGAQVDTNVAAPVVTPGAAPVPAATPAPPAQVALPVAAVATPGTAPAAPPPVTPAPDIMQPPTDFNVNLNGQVYLASALRTAGYTDDQINALPRA